MSKGPDCDDTDSEVPLSKSCEQKQKEEDCGKAKIAQHVYNLTNGNQILGEGVLNSNNVSLVDSNNPILNGLNINFSSDISGFRSGIYRIGHANGDIEFVYSFAGTDDLDGDLGTDVAQAFGYSTIQYQTAYNNAIAFRDWAVVNGYDISFTGHSLGGGLANVAALATGYPALLFNSAGLHDNTITTLGLNLENSNFVEAYAVDGEIVSGLNELSGTPVRGTVTTIDDALGLGTEILAKILGPAGELIKAGKLHTIGEVLNALGCD